MWFVDNSYRDDWRFSDAQYARLERLEREGYKGKHLINEWITDDWAAPPIRLKLTGTLTDGRRIDRTIGYD
jgi:hypothetical protein